MPVAQVNAWNQSLLLHPVQIPANAHALENNRWQHWYLYLYHPHGIFRLSSWSLVSAWHSLAVLDLWQRVGEVSEQMKYSLSLFKINKYMSREIMKGFTEHIH